MLYILNKESGKIGLKLALQDNEAKVVLVEDGCYLNLNSIKGSSKIYAIKEHLVKRGLLEKRSGIDLITYDDLIDLIDKNQVVNFGL